MKITVSSYSFSQYVRKGILTQLSCIEKAKELGLDGIEFSGIDLHDDLTIEQCAQALHDEAERVGLPITSFMVSANLCQETEEDLRKEIDRIKGMVDIAEILGAPLMRHDATFVNTKPFDVILPSIAAACREITEYAQSKGIKTTVENHGQFFQGGARLERLYAAVNHPNFGILADMGNFLCADEAPENAFSILAPFISHVHAKDFYFKGCQEPDPGEGFFSTRAGNRLKGAIIGQGIVPVVQCLQIAKNHGYDGWLSIEYEGFEDCIESIRIGADNLRKYIAVLK